MSFKQIALPMAAMNIPVIRIQPKSKVPVDRAWQNLATTDIDKILAWDSETPGANCACVAKSDGVLFFETDEEGVIQRYEKETGDKFKTFTVSSRKGRFHFYFTQTDESRRCGSITQQEISFGSLRQNNAYVISANSIHPTTGLPYTVVVDAPIIPIPTSLIEWLQAQRTKAKPTAPSTQGDGPIPLGQHDVTLTAVAGKWRQDGLDYETILPALIKTCEKRCIGFGDDYKEMCEKIAKSICRYPAGDPGPTVLIGGKVPGQTGAASRAAANTAQQSQSTAEIITEIVENEATQVDNEYPYWAWNGTLYEDFATICGENNLVPKEYFIEAVKTVVGAICGHRIYPFKTESQESRFYTVLIGPQGCGKSSAVRWARDLFIGTGMIYELSQSGAFLNIGAAQGSFASSSGLIKNGFAKNDRILQVYDEVTAVIEKFGITGSGDSFLDVQNQLFESGNCPQLITKDSKEQPITKLVHNSILGCTTKEKWATAFTKTNAESSGFFGRLNVITNDSDERVANFLDPDLSVLRDQFVRKIQALEYQHVVVDKTPEAIEMLERWFASKKDEWKLLSGDITSRIQVLIHRNASHLAWLMGGDFVPDAEKASEPIKVLCDEDIMARAIALAEYEIVARQLHQPAPGKNDWAIVEGLIKRLVKQRGMIPRNKLFRDIRADNYGIQTFDKAINNLVQEGMIKIGQREGETKRGRKAQILMWVEE